MNYLPLLKLTLKHNYYQSGYCADFSIEADTSTQKILQNYRCILKQTHTGFIIYQAVDDKNVSFISISSKTVFRFHLKLINAQFALFTDFSTFAGKISPTFTNKDITDKQLDLIDSPIPKEKEDFATLEIHITDSIAPDKDTPTHYHIQFTAKSAHWEYFFITNTESESSNYKVEQVQSTESAEPAIIFKNETPQAQEIVDFLIQQYPKEKLFYFISETPVLCQQSPRKNIQILRDNESLLNNLPNPSLNNIKKQFFEDDNNQSTQEAFFHIVKYITRSLPTTGT